MKMTKVIELKGYVTSKKLYNTHPGYELVVVFLGGGLF